MDDKNRHKMSAKKCFYLYYICLSNNGTSVLGSSGYGEKSVCALSVE